MIGLPLFLAISVAGYLRKKLNMVERALFFVAALMFLAPAAWSDIAAIALGAVLIVWCILSGRKAKQTPVTP